MRIGPYEVVATLGRGGMGSVHRARHLPTGVDRALKVLDGSLDAQTIERFRREAESLARVAGEGVVSVHDSGTEGRTFWYAMDLMPRGSLRSRLRERGGRLPWRDAATIVASLARVLGQCHAAGLVHRDVKPDNVLFDEEDRPRLADFGCVRDLGASRLTATGHLVGTPEYMPPEQLRGETVGPPADVFALGVVLHELVTGARPFAGKNLVELEGAIRARRRPPCESGDTPRALDELLDAALDPDPARRPAHGGALARDLDALLAKGDHGRSDRRASATVALSAVAVVAALAAALAWRSSLATRPAVAEPATASSTSPTPSTSSSTAVAPPGRPGHPVAAITSAAAAKRIRSVLERIEQSPESVRTSLALGHEILSALRGARETGLDLGADEDALIAAMYVCGSFNVMTDRRDDVAPLYAAFLDSPRTRDFLLDRAKAVEYFTKKTWPWPLTEYLVQEALRIARDERAPAESRLKMYGAVGVFGMNHGRYDEAAALVDEGALALGRPCDLDLLRAHLKISAGRREEGLADSEGLAARFEPGSVNDVTIRWLRANALLALGRPRDAIAEVASVPEDLPIAFEPNMIRARAAHAIGDTGTRDRAIAAARRLVTNDEQRDRFRRLEELAGPAPR